MVLEGLDSMVREYSRATLLGGLDSHRCHGAGRPYRTGSQTGSCQGGRQKVMRVRGAISEPGPCRPQPPTALGGPRLLGQGAGEASGTPETLPTQAGSFLLLEAPFLLIPTEIFLSCLRSAT